MRSWSSQVSLPDSVTFAAWYLFPPSEQHLFGFMSLHTKAEPPQPLSGYSSMLYFAASATFESVKEAISTVRDHMVLRLGFGGIRRSSMYDECSASVKTTTP